MERIRALINKLQQQAEQQADASAMLVTVQMLQAELSQPSSVSTSSRIGNSKVSVVLPSNNNKMAATIKEPVAEQPVIGAEAYAAAEKERKQQAEPVKPTADRELVAAGNAGNDQSAWLFDPVHEIPTLAHQKEFKEMNDVFGHYNPSLNDKLKPAKTELGAVLKEGPVRDLKKAIGVNDRFVFLSELFRGDDAMYERSIKTINNFRIYQEAEYWIERELKVKLGWDEEKEAVKHFRNLVRRRFL